MGESLPVGTLLLDPGDGSGGTRPTIWTVATARTLTASVEGLVMKGTLSKAGLPKGWRVISNRALAHALKAADERAVKGVLGPVAE